MYTLPEVVRRESARGESNPLYSLSLRSLCLNIMSEIVVKITFAFIPLELHCCTKA